MKRIIHILILLSLGRICFCQDDLQYNHITELAEELAENDQDPEAVNLYIDQLNDLAENPVDINSADESVIARLFFLTDFQVKSLADHVRTTGDIVSLYEIASIPGFDRQAAGMISPFIILTSYQRSGSDSSRFRSSLISNLIFKPGDKDTSAPGSAIRSLSKYKFSAGRIAGGLTIEKDAGERFFPGPSLMPDFFSGYLSYSGHKIIRKIIAGDFSIRAGQGLNLNTGIRTGLSLTSPGYMSSRNELRPYSSTDENNFFRGIAAQIELKRILILLFFSHNKIDASTGFTYDSSATFVKSFYRSGLHDSESALLKKDAVAETSYGLSVNYSLQKIRAGISWSQTRFSLPVNPDKSDPYRLFDFEGNKTGTLSVHYSAVIGRLLLYGESAFNDPQCFSYLQGATIRPSDRLSVNLIYRSYLPGYFSMHGNAAGTASSNRNERGVLGNFTFEAAKNLFISAGCDLSHYLWLRYGCDFPSLSRRTEIRVRYAPQENLSLDLTYNIRYTMQNSYNMQGIPGTGEFEGKWIKAQVKYGPGERTALMTRLDYKLVNPAGSRGMLFIQDLVVKNPGIPVSIWLRYSIFSTDDWDSRLYAYENDLLYSFSIPAFSGKGSRSYVIINWDIGKHAELRAKYAITVLEGGGKSSAKDEIKCQVRIWF